MQKEEGGKTLFVGLDESNNLADFRTNREVICAVFSCNPQDAENYSYSGRRGLREIGFMQEWFKEDKARDYRFALLANNEIRRFQPNTPYLALELIESYLSFVEEKPINLYLVIDGLVTAEQRVYLSQHFLGFFENVSIKGLIKRRGASARRKKDYRLEGPRLIQIADLLAYQIYYGYDLDQRGLTIEEREAHPKRVKVNESTLLRMIRAEKAVRIISYRHQ